MITTDYTESSRSTLCGAPLSRYRFSHWLCDIVKNFMSDPVNIPDERLSRLLFMQDGSCGDLCRALFQVALPYSPDSRKAGTTPAILVSAGESQQQAAPVVNGYNTTRFSSTVQVEMALRVLTGKIAVVTETLDGTLLLSDTIEMFLLTNRKHLENDGIVTQLNVKTASEPQEIKAGEGLNAKALYQTVIGISAVGSISWASDTQGPVFRGMRGQLGIKE